MPETILVTGGAGFVGSTLALRLKAAKSGARVVAFDNLHRRGSELALSRLAAGGVEFVHGDVRVPGDLAAVGAITLLVDCAAEPSVLAGLQGGAEYVVQSNLLGTFHALELAARHGAAVLFLSTSRVYPIAPLCALKLRRTPSRFELEPRQALAGASEHGIAEGFPLAGARSLYGATKLASELLVEEYRAARGLRAIVNRCGVLAGPWQMGKVDQGFVVLWVARHLFGGRLDYIGHGGQGQQVRDVLHVDDLCDLVELQLARLEQLDGSVFNVGGGRAVSVSLQELSALCVARTGRRIEIGSVAEDRPQDVPLYLSDCRALTAATGWTPQRDVATLVDDVARWIDAQRDALRPILG